MRLAHPFIRGIRALFTRRRDDAELREELRAFLDASIEAKVADGMSRADAERAARLELGSALAVEDWTRDVGWESHLESVWQDVRYAIRMLSRHPRFAALAIVTFALGIGVTLAIFTLADGMLFRRLPFADPDRLVLIQGYSPKPGRPYNRVLRVDFEGLRTAHSGIDGVATAWSESALTVMTPAGPDAFTATAMTPNMLALLGVGAHIGRPLRDGDELGDPQPVMLSYEAWQLRFGADPTLVGRTLHFDQRAVEVVGVLPPTFFPPIQGWRASGAIVSVQALDPGEAASARAGVWAPIARLRPGVSVEEAQSAVDLIARRAALQYPETAQDRALRVADLQYALFEFNRPLLWLLLSAAAGVLLIASINLANLLLARGAAREKEIGIRSAIGGSRARIIRQLTIESVVLGICSAVLALLIASTAFDALASYVPTWYQLVDPQVGGRTVLMALLLGIGTSLIFGLAPAARIASRDAHLALRESRRSSGWGPRHPPGGAALVAAEVALCLVILTGTGLMLNSLVRQRTVDLGFDADVLTAFVRTPAGVQGPSAFDLHQQVLREIRKVPRVAAAGIDLLQVGRAAPMTAIRKGPLEGAGVWSVTDNYFTTAGIQLIEGREFSAEDVARAEPVAVISQSAAKRLWPDGPAVGRTLEADQLPPLRVIGVARDVRTGYGGQVHVSVYRPLARDSFRMMTLVMRSPDGTAEVAALARTIVQRIEPRALVGDARPLVEMLDAGIVDSRFQAGLFSLFGLVGLAVAAIGVYSVMAQWVLQRTYEFGVRQALGATSRQLMALVLRQAGVPLAIGLGLAGAFALTKHLQGLLYEITPHDPATFAVVAAVLTLVGLLAAWIPARRAARVDPLVALRAQ